MEEGLSSPESALDGTKKRKRSPHASDADSVTMDGDSTSDSNNGPPSGQTSPTEYLASNLELSSKRAKLQESAHTAGSADVQMSDQVEIPASMSKLPPELWQYVFTFLPPMSLGRLLLVNREFNTLLTPGNALPKAQRYDAKQRLVIDSLQDQDHIWSSARRAYFPVMPRPMTSMTELELWKLLRRRSCQFCGKRATNDLASSNSSLWNSGPGPDNVRVIWPFAVISCGSCLTTRLVKASHFSLL